jgi:hypothetical protein
LPIAVAEGLSMEGFEILSVFLHSIGEIGTANTITKARELGLRGEIDSEEQRSLEDEFENDAGCGRADAALVAMLEDQVD